MARFLHTSDWQIGRRFETLNAETTGHEVAPAPLLMQARFDVVERIARLAHELEVDAVLVAGDVFDSENAPPEVVFKLFSMLEAFSGPWVLLPGNHDPATPDGVWANAALLKAVPSNVRLAVDATPIELPGDLVVLPAPLRDRSARDDVTAWMDDAVTPPRCVRVGLAHGCVTGELPDDWDARNPIARDRAARARLDYLALGDWHGCKEIDARTWYSGTPEPDRFRDNEPGYVLEVDVPAPGAMPSVKTHSVATYRWLTHELTIRGASDIEALIPFVKSLPPTTVLKLSLQGRLDESLHVRLGNALAEARGRLTALCVDRSRLVAEPTAELLDELRRDGYLGDVVRELEEAVQGDDAQRALAREALWVLAEHYAKLPATTGSSRPSRSS
ncbi:MAG: DNA repair exonuclease [Myxococcota bacterium]|nr:DNA repair exonuclease [Myxococcota bacterium]MDW8361665.1 DNA repair exonuclease [Myxococcales bacterium]